jgi:hypothetical protein
LSGVNQWLFDQALRDVVPEVVVDQVRLVVPVDQGIDPDDLVEVRRDLE